MIWTYSIIIVAVLLFDYAVLKMLRPKPEPKVNISEAMVQALQLFLPGIRQEAAEAARRVAIQYQAPRRGIAPEDITDISAQQAQNQRMLMELARMQQNTQGSHW